MIKTNNSIEKINQERQLCAIDSSMSDDSREFHETLIRESRNSLQNEQTFVEAIQDFTLFENMENRNSCNNTHANQNDLTLDFQDKQTNEVYEENSNESSQMEDKKQNLKFKGRKTKEQMKILISYYHLYEGSWDEKNFFELVQKTGFSKKQLNKWFWDRKKKETDALEAKKLSYPGLIFAITNVKTGQDLTPEFKKLCSKPIFIIEKVQK